MPRLAHRTAIPSRDRLRAGLCLLLALAAVLAAAPAARAAFNVTVAQAPTSGGAIDDDGVFRPSADDAVLDVAEANAHLATGDLSIVTGAGGGQAGDIRIEEPLTGPGRQLVLRPAGALSATADLEVGLLVLHGGGEVSGAIGGDGGLYKTGAGTLRLTAASTYDGPTVADGGELRVDGDQPASPVQLTGGILTGTGTVGPVTQGDGHSVVAPGGEEPGTLATGSLTLGAVTTVALEVDGATPGDGPGHHDQLTVAGGVDLGDATLALTPGDVPPIDTPVTLIDNDGDDPVGGTFADLPEDAVVAFVDGLPLRISYAGGDGNDVTVTRRRAPSEVQLMQSEPWTSLGAPLTLTAIVVVDAARPFPTGTITFEADGVAIGGAPLDAIGIASIETAALPVGQHEVTAIYSGDAGTEGSSSLPTSHEVRAVTPPPPPPPPPEPPRPPAGGGDDGANGGNGGGSSNSGDGPSGETPPAPPADPPRVVRRGRTRVVRHGRTLVITTGFALACPRADRACTAAIDLQSRTAGGRRVTIGRGSARVGSGRTAALTLRTDRRSAPRLARGRRERVTVTVVARTGTGAPVTTRRVVRMRLGGHG